MLNTSRTEAGSRQSAELEELPRASQQNRLIGTAEVAKKLGVPESWVRDKCRNRTPREQRLPFIKLGKYVKFSERKIDEWIEAQSRKQ